MTMSQKTTAAPSIPSSAEADAVLGPTASYGEAYAVLSGIAERLRATGSSASIDRLGDDLRLARAAHAVCRARLAAIRAEIDQEVAALDDEATTRS